MPDFIPDKKYTVYCFAGFAGDNSRRIYRWTPSWEQAFSVLDELIAPFSKTSVLRVAASYEMPVRNLRSDPPGTRRVTYKKVAFGRMRWSLETNMTWTQKLLSPSEFPIHFEDIQVLSSSAGLPEVQILVRNWEGPEPERRVDQIMTVSLASTFAETRPDEYWESFVRRLSKVTCAVRVGQACRPWIVRREIDGMTHENHLSEQIFVKRYDSLDFDDDWQDWQYLSVPEWQKDWSAAKLPNSTDC